jgi:predicted PurR-regulated permease PerM
MRRRNAALLVIGMAVGVLVAAVVLVLPAVVEQVSAFLDHVPAYVDQLSARVSAMDSQERAKLRAQLTALCTPAKLADLAGGLLGGAVSVLGGVIIAGTTVMLSLCLLMTLDRVRGGTLRLVVASRRARVEVLTEAVEERVGGYLVGAVGIATVAGTCAFAWCVLAGVPYPAMMALIVAFFDLIPQVGATIGSTIVSLVAFTQSFGLALATIGFFCLYQAVENWLVYPRVMSRAVKVSYLAAIVCALIGGALMGVLGVLVAVPAWASIQMLVREVVIPNQDRR